MDVNVNKQHKDRLFRLLFGNEEYKQNTLDLYNAINGTDYSNLDELEFDTIDDVIYMGMKNDTSFIIHDELNIYEQQSTYNPNMPVRGLMYLGRLYDKFIKKNDLNVYGRHLIPLPVPQYIVFYNGIEKEYRDKDVFELRLSDAFDGKEGCVEFKAIVYNVNYGHNAKLMDACKALSGYAQLIAKIRRYNEEYPLEEAVDKAVSECIKDGILADILTAHKAEVKGMVLTEYNETQTMHHFFKDGEKAKEQDILEKIVKNYMRENPSLTREEAIKMAKAIIS